jgi:programmed cell death protein 4
MSLDKGDRERELVSKLFSALYPDVLSSNTIGKGFERLFEIADEIEKDAPAVKSVVSTFLARAVVDEVLPPSFLADSVVCNLGGEMVEHAKSMLSRDHAGAKLERSWGPGDGRPVEDMKVAVDQVLQEYLLSGDLAEATRCLEEMKAPHFYHEIVKRAVINALDAGEEQQLQMSELLKALFAKEVLSPQQATRGFNRLYLLLPDLVLDTPAAAQRLTKFTERAKEAGILAANYEAPAITAAK